MSAAAILSRLEEAGVSVAAVNGQLKLSGPKAALSEAVLNELRQAKPELLKLLSEPTIQALVSGFSPKTETGERLKQAALFFLASELSQVAAALGWTATELFGVYNHDEPDIINRRGDAKGVVSFVALAVWPGTRIERFEAGYAVIVTGGGGVFTSPRRGDKLSASVPFWQIGAL